MIVVVDVVVDAAFELFDAIELVEMEVFGLPSSKKLSIAALSRQLPLRDMLCVTARSANIRR